jgi:hypothetical protein
VIRVGSGRLRPVGVNRWVEFGAGRMAWPPGNGKVGSAIRCARDVRMRIVLA